MTDPTSRDKAKEALEDVKARIDAATEGPWEAGPRDDRDIMRFTGTHKACVAEFTTPDDARFAANARADLPLFVEAFEEGDAEVDEWIADRDSWLARYEKASNEAREHEATIKRLKDEAFAQQETIEMLKYSELPKEALEENMRAMKLERDELLADRDQLFNMLNKPEQDAFRKGKKS